MLSGTSSVPAGTSMPTSSISEGKQSIIIFQLYLLHASTASTATHSTTTSAAVTTTAAMTTATPGCIRTPITSGTSTTAVSAGALLPATLPVETGPALAHLRP